MADPAPSPAPSPAAGGPAPGRAAWWALGVLTFINLFNYLDRYVPAALVESLRHSELHVPDAASGLLMSGFIVVYTLTSPLFGYFGDRGRRTHIVAAGIALWSLATGLAGMARNFATLLVARSAVGVGEAAYMTISPAILADSFPRSARGRVFAIFNAATPIGAALGYILGGLVGQHFGWRAAFYVAGFPGLLLALLMWRLPDPPRGAHDDEEPARSGEPVGPAAGGGAAPTAAAAAPIELRAAYRELGRNRAFVLTVAGYAAYTFALGALAFWAPAFLERERGVPAGDATVQFGIIVVATGFLGTFAGGWLGDVLQRRHEQAYLWLSGIATLAAAPVALVAFTAPARPIYMTAIVLAELLLFVSTGPINSTIVNVVPPALRATAGAVNILFIHLLGDVPSPPLIGVISDASSLGRAFLVLPGMMALSGLIWMYTGWREARVR
jgi:MFS transporter, Spinster family, sphingosine-1-phosphate transporter